MMRLIRFNTLVVLLMSCLMSVAWPLSGMCREALHQEGKKSVYQKLVTHPGAKLYSGFEQDAKIIQNDLKTFTVMYIYDRQGDRLEVGVSSSKADGWIDQNMVTEWPQAITMLFTDRIGRAPVLFFRDHDAILQTCKADSIARQLQIYTNTLAQQATKLPANFPVIATEPEESSVSEKNFYLLPVLSQDEQFYDNGKGPRLLEVASIDPGLAPSTQGNNSSGSDQSELRTGFAFVIDTTISMKPYIEQTLKLVRNLYDDLEKNPHADKMAFAVVAFRNSQKRTPGIGYTAKVICDFTTVKDRKILEDALRSVEEASIPTHTINEDSFAGIKEAADKLSWQNYGSRVMVLVSDAGPLGADDPDSLTGLSPETLADYLRTNRIYLTALHVKNPRSVQNHSYAAKAYRELTRQSDNQASYIAIDATTSAGGANEFNRAAKALAKGYGEIVVATAEGKFITPSHIVTASSVLSPEEEARRIAASTGYAMQLQFFGNSMGSTAPQVVSAWIADADLEKLEKNSGDAPILAAEPAVLLTKGQLSNLHKQLKILLRGSEQAFLNGDVDLYAQILSAAAQMSRDPGQFSLHPDRNLAENGLLEEVLGDLPYKSRIGSMTRKDWEDMSTGTRNEFIRHLKSLIARYEVYDSDSTHWESFGATNPNEWVYRVPLSMLP